MGAWQGMWPMQCSSRKLFLLSWLAVAWTIYAHSYAHDPWLCSGAHGSCHADGLCPARPLSLINDHMSMSFTDVLMCILRRRT